MTINLFEDNAGGLFIGPDEGPWADVTLVQRSSSFADDAAALAQKDTDDWSVDFYTEEPAGDIIATWEDGKVDVWMSAARTPEAGIAGQFYLRLRENN